jgi:hypothetical protein
MDKRHFLVAGGLGAVWPLQVRAGTPGGRAGVGLLTVTGAIGRSNRGPLVSRWRHG